LGEAEKISNFDSVAGNDAPETEI